MFKMFFKNTKKYRDFFHKYTIIDRYQVQKSQCNFGTKPTFSRLEWVKYCIENKHLWVYKGEKSNLVIP